MHKIFLVLVVAVFLAGCDKNKDKDDFDRKAMLTNMASAVIQPSLNDFAGQVDALNNQAIAFQTNTDATNLNNLKTAFINAYSEFQHVKMFDFGPMMDYGIKASMNTYPTDTTQIQNNISSGSYTLTSLDNLDAIGFPALDFLLYYQGETAVLNSFTIDANAANRMTYLLDITSKMKADFELAHNAWTNYESSFIAADGNDVGSSTSIMFNEFVKDIELVKNAKIGIPAGQLSGGMTLPEQCEAYYSGISTDLAIQNLIGLRNVFTGGTGIGFDDYIADVQDEEVSPNLEDQIATQFDLCIADITAIGNPLSDKVDTAPTAVLASYNELKKLVTYCKTDMSSTLGLLITFQDNDGD